MSSKEGEECMGKSGKLLTAYATAEAAWRSLSSHGTVRVYECPRCKAWHGECDGLPEPPDRSWNQTGRCRWCTGSDGEAKQTYETEQDAVRCADHIWAERRVKLRAYACRYGSGWHLTSNTRKW